MKMTKITITVHTAREAIYADELYDEVHQLLKDWARRFVKNTLTNESVTDDLDNFINDIELPSGPVGDALSKENTTITVKIK